VESGAEASLSNGSEGLLGKMEKEKDNDSGLDIILNNVVCNFSVRCHLNLRTIAMTGHNVEYHKSMAVSHPYHFLSMQF
jgi:TATA-box binding protein (TBP) (component of TFIID and TFIIIB)